MIGERLNHLRGEKRLSLDSVVQEMNEKYSLSLHKGMLSKWERGIDKPSLRYVAYLAQYYGVSIDYLAGLTDLR